MKSTHKHRNAPVEAGAGRGRRRRSRWVGVAGLCAALLLQAGAGGADEGPVKKAPAGENGEKIELARDTLEKWVEVRRVIAKERHEWELAREMLQSRIDTVQRQIEAERKRIEETREDIAEAEADRAELMERKGGLESAEKALADRLADFERRTRGLLSEAPPTFARRVERVSEAIPEDPKKTKLGLDNRYANVIGVLNEANKFNNEFVTTPEVHTLPDGDEAEVTVVYVGLGQAYALSGDGEAAMHGVPGEGGWQWNDISDLAPRVADVIAVLNAEQIASFIPLPVEIDSAEEPTP
jgi:hypothetical protein